MTQSPSPSVDEVARAIDKHIDAAPVDGINAEGDYNLNVFNQQQSYVDGLKVARLAAMNALAASLVSPPKAAGELVPVAWQWRPKVGGSWRLMHESATEADFEPNVCEYRPLYANHEARGDGVRVTANCCVCGRIIDTREKAEGGDDFGAQLEDGRWTCSFECAEKAAPELAALEAALPPFGDGRAEIVEAAAKVAEGYVDAIGPEYADAIAAAIRSLSNPGGGE